MFNKISVVVAATLLLGVVMCSTAHAVPAAPTVTYPAQSEAVMTNRPDIAWTASQFDAYEVHVSLYDTPSGTLTWDSGVVSVAASTSGSAMCGSLSPINTYYVFARIHDSTGWSPWSSHYRRFYVQAGFLPCGTAPTDDPFCLDNGADSQRDQSVCYDPVNNQYAVAYADWASSPWMSTHLIGANGGSRFGEIRTLGGNMSGMTTIAYNSVHNEFLATDVDFDGKLMGQRIDASTGAIIADSYYLTSSVRGPDLAYGSGSDVYLFVYSDPGIRNVYAQRINGATGQFLGSRIDIDFTTGALAIGSPKACYNPDRDEFLVTYQREVEVDVGHIYARVLRASDGAVITPVTSIASRNVRNISANLNYIHEMGKYLMVWEDWVPGVNVAAQFINTSGAPDGAAVWLVPYNDPYHGGGGRIAWNPNTSEFLLTWTYGDSFDCYGRRFTQSLTPIGQTFRINGTVGPPTGNFETMVMANTVDNEAMFVWMHSYTAIYMRRYKSYGAPSADTTPPSPVTGLTATPGPSRITLNWTNPGDSDFAATIIRYKTSGYPTSPTDGTLATDQGAVPGSADTYTQTDLSSSATYYFSAWSYDEATNYATTVAHATGSPLPLPGAPVITSPVSGTNITSLTPTITWSSDTHDQYQVRISQLNDSNTSVNGWDSGTVTSAANSCVSGLLRDMSIYLVFARVHNSGGWGNWSVSGYTFTTRTTADCVFYPADLAPSASGWALYDFGIESGPGISSSIPADGGSNVFKIIDTSIGRQCKARYSASNVAFDTGASMAVRMKATGTIVNPGPNAGISNGGVGGMYISVTTTDVRLVEKTGTVRGSYSLDGTVYHKYQLTVKNATTGNNATALWTVYVDGIGRIYWTGAGTDDSFDGYMIGAGPLTATGTWWIDWAAGRADGAYSPAQWDPTSPDQNALPAPTVTDDGYFTGSLSTLHCSWSSVPGATQYRCSIGTYPSGNNVVGWTTVGLALEVTRTGLSLSEGQTYYFSIQADNGSGIWGEQGSSNGIGCPMGLTIPGAKALADDDGGAIRGKMVTAASEGYFYIQDPLRPYGIKIVSNAVVTLGQTVDVAGMMVGAGGERAIDATKDKVEVSAGTPVQPTSISNLALGGADLNEFTPGVAGGVGLNNLGLLVRCWGKVSNVEGNVYQISDGSVGLDGLPLVVIVQARDAGSVPMNGAFTVVEGISSMLAGHQRLILAR